jgi:hypothetical protein
VEFPRNRILSDVCKGRVSPSVSAGAGSARDGCGVRWRCLIYPGVGRLEGKTPVMLLVGRLLNGPGKRDIRINVTAVRPPVKSSQELLPRVNMKAARSVNHRGLVIAAQSTEPLGSRWGFMD